MKRAVIVHCWGGTPNYCWYPWLKGQLEARGFEVQVPALPDTDLPQLQAWLTELTKTIGTPDEDLYLITHSLGTATALHYLSQLPAKVKIGGMVVIAGNFTDRGYQEMANFFHPAPDTAQALTHVIKPIGLIYSDDDPWMPPAEGRQYQTALNGHFTLLKGKGHFSGPLDAADSCTELPEALNAVEKLSK